MNDRPPFVSAPAFNNRITKMNSTITAPAYTITCAAAINSPPSSRYSTAREPITPMSEMALEIGCVCTTTLTALTTAMIAKTRKRMTSILREPGHQQAGHQQIQHGYREHEFPREAHQLVVAEPRQCPADPDESEQNRTRLGNKPE